MPVNGTVSSAADWVLWFVANVGGPAAVVSALFAWLGKRYLDRALEAERLKNASRLEEVKAVQQKRILVHRAQFEVEFQAYQSIWSSCAELMDNVARLLTLYDRLELPEHRGAKSDYRNRADAAIQAAITASDRHAPFIAPEVRQSATALILAARDEVEGFSGALDSERKGSKDYDPDRALQEARAGFAGAKSKWNLLESAIRERIAALSILDA